jgi:alkylation response protein AidB-like acyl-CoA dehydrogenase
MNAMSLDSLLAELALARIPETAEALRPKVRAFLAQRLQGMRPVERVRSWTAWDSDFSRDLSAQGWVGITIPKQYGGAGLGPFHRFVVVEELLAAGAPVGAHWIGDRQSAPLLLKFGTEEQRRRFLPAIVRSDLFFCIGMSEPASGSDLASVRTRAMRANGGWLVNGQKIWTTGGHRADWMIALVRTSGTFDDKHKGLSQLLVDLRAPGVTVRPIRMGTGEAEFAEVRFSDAWLPEDSLVGAEGNGWSQVNAELAFERSGPERFYSSVALLETWASRHALPASELHMDRLGRWIASLTTLRQMSIALTARLAAGDSPVIGAALVKDMGTALEQEIPSFLMELVDQEEQDSEFLEALALGYLLAPSFSIRGGTREILRGMIARRLGIH